jgi:hypothetical protein
MTEKGAFLNLTNFAGQNWLITPAAPALGEHLPASIHDHKWLLVLTGVVTANLQGNSKSHWLNANLVPSGHCRAQQLRALELGHQPICNPEAGRPELRHRIRAGQWAPFVSLSAIYDQAQSIDAGYAVNVWRSNCIL